MILHQPPLHRNRSPILIRIHTRENVPHVQVVVVLATNIDLLPLRQQPFSRHNPPNKNKKTHNPRHLRGITPNPRLVYINRVPILTDFIHIDDRHLQSAVVVDVRVRETALDRGVDGGAADDAAGYRLVDQVAAGHGDALGGLAQVEGSVEEGVEGEGAGDGGWGGAEGGGEDGEGEGEEGEDGERWHFEGLGCGCWGLVDGIEELEE